MICTKLQKLILQKVFVENKTYNLDTTLQKWVIYSNIIKKKKYHFVLIISSCLITIKHK